MRYAILFAIIATTTAPALACSCSEPETAAEKRAYARLIAAQAQAIVEVEPVAGPDIQRQVGETYRIVRVIAGQAEPGLIRMARSFGRDPKTGEAWMSGSSCDVFPGQRQQVLLIRSGFAPRAGGAVVAAVARPAGNCVLPIRDASADLSARGYVPVYSFGGSCQDWFRSTPGALDLIREEARGLGRPGY